MKRNAATMTVALESVWDQFSDRLRSFIRARVADEDAVEDILQDVFVRIHAKVGTLQDLVTRLASDVREMVEALPEPYREALVLTSYEGLSQKELAKRLGLSYSGAKSRVQRARERVKDMLMTCCHLEFDRRGTVIDYYDHCCCCATESHPG